MEKMKEIDEIIDKNKHLIDLYNKNKTKKRLFIVILIPLVILLVGLSIDFGSADIRFLDVYKTVFNKIFPFANSDITANHVEVIIWKIRLPRIIMGVLTGITLGSTGAVMQVVLKNPLADPYMLGISSAAGFGASLAIVFGVGFFAGEYLIIGNAFIFSIISAGLILLISSMKNSTPGTMVLTGLALMFFFQAMTTIIQYFGNSEAVKSAVFWTVGDLGKADWSKIKIATPLVFVGEILLIYKSGDLNVMNTGDASAKSLGINVQGTRIFTMFVSSIMVAGIVSFTGTIGFIGLVAPHIVRMIVGNDNRILVPASGLVGAVLLVLADTVARTIISPVILPVGSVTAFLGVPLFVYLILKGKAGAV